MKTHSIALPRIDSTSKSRAMEPARKLSHVLCIASKAFVAAVPALTLVVGAAWLITVPELVLYLQATLWALGFVFLGLAIDSEKPGNFLALATGITLPVLAMLSSFVAVEIAVVAAALVAAWIAALIYAVSPAIAPR